MDAQAIATAIIQALQQVMQPVLQGQTNALQQVEQALQAQANVLQLAAAGPFATTLALARQAGVLDYTCKADAAIFTKATKALDTSFNVDKPNSRVFMVELAQRAHHYGWNDILTVAVNGNG